MIKGEEYRTTREPERRRTVSLIILFAVIAGILVFAPDVLFVIFAGLLFGVFFGGGGGWLARLIGIARGWGVGLFVLLIIIVIIAAVLGFAPVVAEQFDRLVEQVPPAIERLRGRVQEYPWGDELLQRATPGALMPKGGTAATAVSTTFGALGNFVIMLFIGLYVALDPETYRRGFISLLAPSWRSAGDEILGKVAK